MQKVNSNSQYFAYAKSKFASSADGWVAAYAYTIGATVVTQEVFKPDIKKRVPLPNVCDDLEVEYMNTFELLRELDVVFTQNRDEWDDFF